MYLILELKHLNAEVRKISGKMQSHFQSNKIITTPPFNCYLFIYLFSLSSFHPWLFNRHFMSHFKQYT